MAAAVPGIAANLGKVVKSCIEDGLPVELDGLGTFQRSGSAGLEFVADTRAHVFIAYVEEDAASALRLADELQAVGMKPWIDKRKLMPGQHWRSAIQRAIERADFVVVCFSRIATRKRGHFPCEVRQALRCADRMPLDDEFMFPVRLEECELPHRITSHIQHVDLFPSWDRGVARLINSIEREFRARRDRETQ